MRFVLIGRQLSTGGRNKAYKVIDSDTMEWKMIEHEKVRNTIIYHGVKVAGLDKMTFTDKNTYEERECLYLPFRKIPNLDELSIVNEAGEVIKYADTRVLIDVTNKEYKFIDGNEQVYTVEENDIEDYLKNHTVIGFQKDSIKLQAYYREIVAGGQKTKQSLYDWCQEHGEQGQKLLDEWDYDKNNEIGITPDKITRGNKQKVYWICSKPECRYSWSAAVLKRTSRGDGCPECKRKRLSIVKRERSLQNGNDLLNWCKNNGELGQRIMDEWDTEKNNELGIYIDKVSRASGEIVYWRCKQGHSWKTDISHRTRKGSKCPECRGRGISFGEKLIYNALKQHIDDLEYNFRMPKGFGGLELDICSASYRLAIEYNGYYYHRVLKDGRKREQEKSEICAQRNIRLIHINDGEGYIEPEIHGDIIEFVRELKDYEEQLQQVVCIILNELGIKGEVDFEKAKELSNRDVKSGIPYEKSLAAVAPAIAAEWNYELNKGLKPEDFSYGSGRVVKWLCPCCGYGSQGEWETSINYRTASTNSRCPNCKSRELDI